MDFEISRCSLMKTDKGPDWLARRSGLKTHKIIVEAGQFRAVCEQDGEVLVDTPVDQVVVCPPKRMMPDMASLDAGGHHWVVDFSQVARRASVEDQDALAKLMSAANSGNIQSVKAGKKIRDQFLAAIRAAGASAR